jgi:alpha-galactosidase
MRNLPLLLPLLILAACAKGGDSGVPADAVDDASCTPGPTDLDIDGTTLAATRTGCGTWTATVAALGEGELQITLEPEGDGAIVPVVTAPDGGVLTGVTLDGTATLVGEGTTRVLRQGYQSWSWSGVVEAPEAQWDDDGLPINGGDGDASSVIFEKDWTSWWVGVHGPETGARLLVGALSATQTKWWLGYDAPTERVVAVWGGRGEAMTLEAGETVRLSPVRVAFGPNESDLLADYADASAEASGARPLTAPPPVGWATWYQFYSAVTEDDVRDNLGLAAGLAARSDLAPLRVFQIDDGWQRAWGEWTAGDDFPSGMATLAADITAAGLTPGLWMAPFYVHRDTDTWRDHPDWWVRDSTGEELRFTNLGSGDYAVIDATHPEAGPWMAQQIADRVAEGWTYLKLDFLYAGAEEGVRYADVTGTEAYAIGLGLLREAAGDSWILACGAPMLPSLGFAEQYRTGADIAFEVSEEPDAAFLRWQARSTAARAWTNGTWWWIDPDQVILRPPFTEAEARAAVVAQAVSGGAWLLGDDLAGLSEDRLKMALHPEIVALRGSTATPVDLFQTVSGIDPSPVVERTQADDQVPTRWEFPDGTVALLNLSAETVTLSAPAGVEALTGVQTAADAPWTLEPADGAIWLAP